MEGCLSRRARHVRPLEVRELSEWMRDDAYSEVLVGRVFVIWGVKFAEMAMAPAQFSAERLLIGCRDPATTAAVDDLTVLRTPRGSGNFPAFLGGLA